MPRHLAFTFFIIITVAHTVSYWQRIYYLVATCAN